VTRIGAHDVERAFAACEGIYKSGGREWLESEQYAEREVPRVDTVVGVELLIFGANGDALEVGLEAADECHAAVGALGVNELVETVDSADSLRSEL